MNATDFTFLRLEEDRLEELLGLERQCFACPWDAAQFRLAFTQRVFHVFGLLVPDLPKPEAGVAALPGSLAAYCSVYMVPPEMEILNIAVRAELRRLGLGKRLLTLVLQIGRKLGIQETYLEVRASNAPAHALYARTGFLQVGVRPRYYPDTGEDALVMRLEMQPPPV